MLVPLCNESSRNLRSLQSLLLYGSRYATNSPTRNSGSSLDRYAASTALPITVPESFFIISRTSNLAQRYLLPCPGFASLTLNTTSDFIANSLEYSVLLSEKVSALLHAGIRTVKQLAQKAFTKLYLKRLIMLRYSVILKPQFAVNTTVPPVATLIELTATSSSLNAALIDVTLPVNRLQLKRGLSEKLSPP